MASPCAPWADESDLCTPCLEDAYSVDFSTYLEQASELLYQLSGQQFPGTCTVTIAPCSQRFSGHPTQYEPFMTTPLRRLTLEHPFPWTGCGHDDICGCPGFPSIQLPHPHITAVTEVIIDGYPLASSSYELQAPYLVRTDGDRWPTCDDTFTVTYEHGISPPISGVRAAAVLACELLLACEPNAITDAKCRLPRNISSISRQGISVIFERLTRTRGPFRFGIWEIDTFLEAFNPNGVSAPSVIMSPDTMNLGRRIP